MDMEERTYQKLNLCIVQEEEKHTFVRKNSEEKQWCPLLSYGHE